MHFALPPPPPFPVQCERTTNVLQYKHSCLLHQCWNDPHAFFAKACSYITSSKRSGRVGVEGEKGRGCDVGGGEDGGV